jgi:hypothetical protein
MKKFNLAQINIAKAISSMDSEIMKGFVDRLDEMNNLADVSPGFIWRLKAEGDAATTNDAYEDPSIIVNMSVWNDLESLKHYVYKSAHLELLKDKNAWFHKMPKAHHTLWWVPVSHTPSISEGKERLEHFQENGASEFAFNFVKSFPAPR